MKVFLHEISDQDKDLQFNAEDPWVYATVTRMDEDRPKGRPAPALSEDKKDKTGKRVPQKVLQPDRVIQAEFSLRKVDDVVIVNGDVTAPVRLLCSRCATPFQAPLHPKFQMLFTKDPMLAGLTGGKSTHHSEKGSARHTHDTDSDKDEHDVDISFLKEEFIDLSAVLSEQLQLTLPFQPLCKADCRGICGNCGADLNKGRCACDKIAKSTPFAVLKDLKPKAPT